MKDVFLIYDSCCFFEIVTLSYFMRFSGCDLVFCTPEGRPVKVMEGFMVQPDLSIEKLDRSSNNRIEICVFFSYDKNQILHKCFVVYYG